MDERLRVPLGLSAALVVAAGGASAMTLCAPSVLLGPAVMNGSARGTALVVLVFALPLLGASMVLGLRGFEIGVVGWVGSSAYLAYNGVLFLFATPFNRLFLGCILMLALSIWTLMTLLTSISPRAVSVASVTPVTNASRNLPGSGRGPRLSVARGSSTISRFSVA